jgi:hypothetical protein
MTSAMLGEYAVPGAMMAVPLAEPLGMSPGGLARNRSSNCVCDMLSSFAASYSMLDSFGANFHAARNAISSKCYAYPAACINP